MGKPIEEANLDNWLTENGGKDYIKKFHDLGYASIDDLDQDGITKAVDKLGIRRRLLNALKKRKDDLEAKAETKEHQPPPPPELPTGATFDLSSKQSLKTPDGIKFTLPTEVQAAPGDNKPVGPGELSPTDWMVIAKNNQLLRAWRMNASPQRAEHSVALWKVSDDDFFEDRHLGAQVETTLVYTLESSRYVHEGVDTISASASYACCSASFEREHRERFAESQELRSLHMTGRYSYPRAQLLLDRCIVAHPAFEQSIKDALDATADQQVAALTEVLNKFGHAYPRKVDIGGLLFFEHVEHSVSKATTQSVQDKISAAVSVKTAAGGGSAGYSKSEASETEKAAFELSQTITFTARGGKSTLASNPSAWADTVNNPKLWAVTGFSEMRPTYKLLSADLQKKVENILKCVDTTGDGRSARLYSLGQPGILATDAMERIIVLPDEPLTKEADEAATWRIRYCGINSPENEFWIQSKGGRGGSLISRPGYHNPALTQLAFVAEIDFDVVRREGVNVVIKFVRSGEDFAFAAHQGLFYIRPARVYLKDNDNDALDDAYFLLSAELEQALVWNGEGLISKSFEPSKLDTIESVRDLTWKLRRVG